MSVFVRVSCVSWNAGSVCHFGISFLANNLTKMTPSTEPCTKTLTYLSESGTLLTLAKWVAKALTTRPTPLVLQSLCFLPPKEVPHLKRGRRGGKGGKKGVRERSVAEERGKEGRKERRKLIMLRCAVVPLREYCRVNANIVDIVISDCSEQLLQLSIRFID